ncbi:unnamed protein product [Acanthosepion pharaonis]|uniref:Uncharacterized protein n=1 Tax=Acanthosepion pharaonis TaxID=158019 RepID=A0A812DTC9_ACAPH|nr:unnamed protein product [Sepia pharaonis]
MLTLVQLDDHVQELWRTPKSPHDLPHSSSSHCVKCFHQINEHYIQPLVLLPTLLLQLLENKHVCCTPVGSEATLTLWKVLFCNVGYQPVQQNPCNDLSCDGEQCNPSVFGAVRFFPFVLVQGNDDCITQILYFSFLPTSAKEYVESHMQHWTPMLPDLRWDSIDSC